jgi:hypothetical protein
VQALERAIALATFLTVRVAATSRTTDPRSFRTAPAPERAQEIGLAICRQIDRAKVTLGTSLGPPVVLPREASLRIV